MDDWPKVLRNAQKVRSRLRAGEADADPSELMVLATSARKATDWLEAHLAQSVMARAAAQMALIAAEDALEVAEAESGLGKGEYESAREFDLKLKVVTLTLRRDVNRAKMELTNMRAVEEFLRTLHRGADNARRDVDTRLRALSLITTMER